MTHPITHKSYRILKSMAYKLSILNAAKCKY